MSEAVLTDIENEKVEKSSVNTDVQTLKVGLIMPISNTEGYPLGHWNDVRRIIEEALSEINELDCDVSMVSESEDVTLIQKTIIQRIFEDDIVIVDVSSKNPNVMFELGVRLASDKAFILMKDDVTDYIFDISSIHHINYRKDLRYSDVVDVKEKIKSKLVATFEKSKIEESMYLKDFGRYEVAKLESKELPVKEYFDSMIKDFRKELKNVPSNNYNNSFIDNAEKRTWKLRNIIMRIVKNHLNSNPSIDKTKIYYKSHGIHEIIKSDKEVYEVATNLKEVEDVTYEVFHTLNILPF